MPSIYDRIYAKSPVWVQNLGMSVYGVIWRQRRYGGDFTQLVDEFQWREGWTAEQWQGYQLAQLRKLLQSAARHTPYYRNLFAQVGLGERKLDEFRLEDLTRIPLLEKDAIRRDPEAFVYVQADRRRLHAYLTSGTTGTPLTILSSTQTDRAVNAAYEARVRRWAGLDYRMSRAMIGGRLVVPRGEARPPFWRYNLAERQLYMSAFHIAPDNIPAYVSVLNRYRPDYLVGYASAHFFLARMIEEQGLKVFQPKAVLTSSEKLTDEMRQTIQRVYCCEVFDGYSGVENCCLASECEYHRMHLSPDVGIVELLAEDGGPAPPGEAGEIVATGLLNFDQPLIRYRTGDFAILSDRPCACGREMPVLEELVGRLEDTVIGPDGRETVRFHGIFVGLPCIREGQIVQKTYTQFLIRLAVAPGFGDEEKKVIRQRFAERLGPIDLKFEFVDQIERTERGKFRAVISHVPRQ
jgi:phenylacetate-CoA ligase